MAKYLQGKQLVRLSSNLKKKIKESLSQTFQFCLAELDFFIFLKKTRMHFGVALFD